MGPVWSIRDSIVTRDVQDSERGRRLLHLPQPRIPRRSGRAGECVPARSSPTCGALYLDDADYGLIPCSS